MEIAILTLEDPALPGEDPESGIRGAGVNGFGVHRHAQSPSMLVGARLTPSPRNGVSRVAASSAAIDERSRQADHAERLELTLHDHLGLARLR